MKISNNSGCDFSGKRNQSQVDFLMDKWQSIKLWFVLWLKLPYFRKTKKNIYVLKSCSRHSIFA